MNDLHRHSPPSFTRPARPTFIFRARDKQLELGRRTRIMGVVNITPDSFSDGGQFLELEQAVEHALLLVEQGADLLDLGGESSRPGAEPVSAEVEIDRVLPVIEAIRSRVSVPISVDTYKSAVAQAAFQAGADLINDISALRLDASMPAVVAEWQGGLALMHMRGTPRDMQLRAPSPDIFKEILEDLEVAVEIAYKHQIAGDRILVDPGIGFGKTAEDNLAILNRLSFLDSLQLPILVGTSRKSFLGKITGAPVGERQTATAASVAAAILNGAHMVRVHDLPEMRQVADVADAVMAEKFLL